ncbi:tetratricopeptide repeat protein [Phormidium tenue FACHB-886]|nr:tetratricopeptide repeat protein [Phormidium tenue FACHB-886]
MSQAIEEAAAIAFAVGFYDALGAGRDIEFAYQFGCSAAQLSGENDLKPVLKKQRNAKPAVPIVSTSSQLFSPAIYNASTWVERADVTEPLVQILQEGCRVLTLTGITGIGKTALAERLIATLQDEGRFCRLNLDEGGVSAEFAISGAALLRSLGEEPTLDDQKNPQNLLTHLLQLLRTQPHCVQLDSMERLLKEDDRQGWSEFCDPLWLDLLQQLLGGNECQSQLILTTQELPGELKSVGSRYPQRWYCEPIRGLSEAEQLELFAKRGVADPDTDYLQRIGKLYDGHPLVLRVIAEDIKACGGTVQRYWQQGKFAEFEANRPAQLSRRKLQLEVKQRVKDALAQLPSDAMQLLCRSAVYRRPVPASFWLAMLPERSHLEAALELLKARGLAEEEWEEGGWLGVDGEIPLRQHNLIRSVAYEQLKVDTAVWQAAERTAAEQWLNHYEAVPEAANLEQVRGYLEAFDHYCDLEDWQEAKGILLDQKIGSQLQTWSHYQEVIVMYGRLAKRLEATDEVACLEGLGNAHLFLSNYKQAIDDYQQSLELAREIGDRQGEGRALGNLGTAYNRLGNCHEAIEFHRQYLAIAQEIGDRRGEGIALGKLGIAQHSLNCAEAIEFYQQALAIAREIGNRQAECTDLGSLGLAYYSLGNYSEAIAYHQQSLAVAREIGNRQAECTDLGSLGLAYYKLGNYSEAIEYAQQHLNVAREIGDRPGEGAGLRELGAVLIKLEQHSEALENLQNALSIFREVNSRTGEAETLKNLAELHQKTGSSELARQECDQALAIATELGIPLVKECEDLREVII